VVIPPLINVGNFFSSARIPSRVLKLPAEIIKRVRPANRPHVANRIVRRFALSLSRIRTHLVKHLRASALSYSVIRIV